jgi:hypothetical protein
METGPDARDKWDEHEFYEDLITLFYIFILLVCVLFGHSAYPCLYVIVLVNVASILCNLFFPSKKQSALCLVPPSPRGRFSVDARCAAPAGFVR